MNFTLEQGHGTQKLIAKENVVVVLPISDIKRDKQGWDARFQSQVVLTDGSGGLDVRTPVELARVFKSAGIELAYIPETNELVNRGAIKSIRTFKGKDDAPVQYFHSVAQTVAGREHWLAATPAQIADARVGVIPAPAPK